MFLHTLPCLLPFTCSHSFTFISHTSHAYTHAIFHSLTILLLLLLFTFLLLLFSTRLSHSLFFVCFVPCNTALTGQAAREVSPTIGDYFNLCNLSHLEHTEPTGLNSQLMITHYLFLSLSLVQTPSPSPPLHHFPVQRVLPSHFPTTFNKKQKRKHTHTHTLSPPAPVHYTTFIIIFTKKKV